MARRVKFAIAYRIVIWSFEDQAYKWNERIDEEDWKASYFYWWPKGKGNWIHLKMYDNKIMICLKNSSNIIIIILIGIKKDI